MKLYLIIAKLNIDEILEKAENIKGEMIIFIEGGKKTLKENPLNSITIEEHYKYYENQGLDKKEIIKKVAKDRGVTKNEIYKLFV